MARRLQPAACQKASEKEFRKNSEFHTGENTPLQETCQSQMSDKQACQSKKPHNERQNALPLTNERQTIGLINRV